MHRIRIHTLLMVFIISTSIFAQIGNRNKNEPIPSFSISFYYSVVLSGPTAEIEAVMVKSGFNENSNNWFSSVQIIHPKSDIAGIPWMINLDYLISNNISLGLVISNSPNMETIGYANPQGAAGEFLFLNYSVLTVAPAFIWNFNNNFRLTLAPSINSISTYVNSAGQATDEKTSLNFGFLVDAAARFFFTKVLFADLRIQYRFVGSTSVGPFIKENTIGILTPNPSTVYITFPETEINFNQIILGIGVGLAF